MTDRERLIQFLADLRNGIYTLTVEEVADRILALTRPELTDAEIRAVSPNPAIDPARIREQLRTEARP